jgi:hypothetical protein
MCCTLTEASNNLHSINRTALGTYILLIQLPCRAYIVFFAQIRYTCSCIAIRPRFRSEKLQILRMKKYLVSQR